MRLTGAVMLSTVVLTSCVSVETGHAPDALAGSLAQAAPHECPLESSQAGARTSGETERAGVTERELTRVPLSNGRGVLRQRRLDIAPGGVLPWHEHTARQGIAILLEGEMTEYRNDCREPLRFHPGDMARETMETAHFWRNETGAPAAVLVTDVLAE